MTSKYAEWAEEAAHEVKKGVLMTMSHICDRRHKSDMNYFTSQQLDDLKDCVAILAGMHGMHKNGHCEHSAHSTMSVTPRA